MKVLIISQYYPPDMGGASARSSNVVKGLVQLGYSVIVITAFPHYPEGNIPKHCKGKALIYEKQRNIDVYRVWMPSIAHNNIANRMILHLCFILSSLFVLPFIREYDIIWAANPNIFSFFPSLLYSFVHRKSIVRNVDDLWPEVFYDMGVVKSNIIKYLLDFISLCTYKISKAITLSSYGYQQTITEKYHININKIHVIEVGIDLTEVTKIDVKDKNKFIVMYSGILGTGYDFRCVLEAAKKLSEYNSIQFVIRGKGELKNKLKKSIHMLKLNNVCLDENYVPKKSLSRILNSADVFLLPMSKLGSSDKGLPTKIFEYQAYGKPIVCSSSGEPARYIQKTNSGIVVKLGDSQKFADAILNLYDDRDKLQQLGNNGFAYVTSYKSCKAIGKKMSIIFKNVLNEGNRQN